AARAALQNAPGGATGALADMLEPFLLAAEGQVDRAVERVDAGGDNLPAPLPEMERAPLLESAGRLHEAAAVYARMAARLDPAPLPEMERALLFESAGRLNEAAAVYAQMVERLDLTPPGDDEPQSIEEFERVLNSTRVAHAVYRAALVHHRLGRVDAARRYYN